MNPQQMRDFMETPGRWPRWPMLPLKKKQEEKGGILIVIGFLLDSHAKVEPTVYIGNIYDPKSKELDKVGKIQYANFEALCADGWVVD